MGSDKKIKYKYDFSEKEFIINPYTFVEGKNEVKRSEKGLEEGSHTGVFTCRLYPKTPVLIPDPFDKKLLSGREGENLQHYFYPFFRLKDKPAIPGGSIRGPLRNMYETLTGSCYSTAGKEKYITARTKAPFLPGLLKKIGDTWKLYSAKRYLLPIKEYGEYAFSGGKTESYYDIVNKYGKHVCFKGEDGHIINKRGNKITQHRVIEVHSTCEPGDKEGYYYIGEYINRKKYESIFVEDSELSSDTDNIKKYFQQLKEVQKIYRDEKVNQKFKANREAGEKEQHGGYSHVDLESFEGSANAVLPIWYKEIKKVKKDYRHVSSEKFEEEKYYFSLANIGRFRYEKSIDDILGTDDKGRMPCQDLKKLCKACSMFGMFGVEEGLGSRVRVTDAIFEGAALAQVPSYNLKELRTPHPSYIPFYTITDDYSLGYDAKFCNIKGRKFYWHSTPEYENLKKLETDKIDAKMEGIGEREGSFVFKVYFEKLTDKQLAELAMLLCMGENKKDGKYCFKLGHGKPFGFGSAKIVVESLEERNFDSYIPEYSVKSENLIEKEPASWRLFEKEDIKTELKSMQISIEGMKNILSIDSVSKLGNDTKVAYPYVKDERRDKRSKASINDLASSKWFSENWKLGDSAPKNFLKSCAVALEKRKLPVLEISEDFRVKNQKNRRY